MSNVIPLAVPDELCSEIRKVAEETHLSQADVIRQSMKLGLAKLREQAGQAPLKRFTKVEAREAFGPDPEFDALAAHCASLPKPPPRDD